MVTNTQARMLNMYAALANSLPQGSKAQQVAVARWLAYATI